MMNSVNKPSEGGQDRSPSQGQQACRYGDHREHHELSLSLSFSVLRIKSKASCTIDKGCTLSCTLSPVFFHLGGCFCLSISWR
jgi:hypothetical protein